jgi:hypothetical protein
MEAGRWMQTSYRADVADLLDVWPAADHRYSRDDNGAC